jgi:peptidyl-prolyl cis-trans isomerase A (cyclophilin A)
MGFRYTNKLLQGLAAVSLALLAVDCRRTVPPPQEEKITAPPPSASAATKKSKGTSASSAVAVASQTLTSAQSANVSAQTVPEKMAVSAGNGDPLHGQFPLAEAVKGLNTKGRLLADIDTDKGKLHCELYDDKAPIAVANFVGLARGLRPFKDPKSSEWVKRPGYDGTGFHRIVKGFMIQGGDPAGTGAGEPGYVFADEIWSGATHDRRGLICMANRGPNTNGMQFFILDGEAKHLDHSFTIFGQCSPNSIIEKLAGSEVRGDRAVSPPKIFKVTIRRK